MFGFLLILTLGFANELSANYNVHHPNIIFILADDLGWDDVSFHGSRQIPTPNLDTLAYDGIILNNYHVQYICTPSRGALMTGRHPIHTGLQTSVIYANMPYGLGLNETILPQYLKELGYNTHMVGKWHLGFMEWAYTPTFRGFDSHFGFYTGKGDYWDHTNRFSGGAWGLDLRMNMDPVKDAFGQYSTELFTKRAEKIIHEHDPSKPLFLYFAHQATHNANRDVPLEAPWHYMKRFDYIKNKQRRIFAGMASALDDSVGNVTKALHRKGMLNNTIIVFSTDNGGPAAGASSNMACNFPLRGVKYTLWEGGHRATSFIWSPLLKQSGYKADYMMHITDWLPTLLSAAGYDMSKLDPEIMDGIDQWETLSLRDTSGLRTEMLINIDPSTNSSALRVNNMKLIQGAGGHEEDWDGWYKPGEVNRKGIQQGMVDSDGDLVDMSHLYEGIDDDNEYVSEDAPDYLFNTDLLNILESIGRNPVHPLQGDPYVVKCGLKPKNASSNCDLRKGPCLYNITADPCEYYNLAPERQDIVKELQERLSLYEDSMVKPRNKPSDPRANPQKYFNGIWTPWLNGTSH